MSGSHCQRVYGAAEPRVVMSNVSFVQRTAGLTAFRA